MTDMSVALWVRNVLARIPAMFLTVVLASAFGWYVAYGGSPRVGGPFFESLLPLVYTVPAVGLAYYGLMRGQAPKAAQVADSLRDKEWRQFSRLASWGIVFLVLSVGTGLRYSSSSFTVAADSPTRLAAWIMVVSSLVGASALVQSLAVYRRGLDPRRLALRLRDDFQAAAITDVRRSTQRADDLLSMALLAAEQGRVADFVEFVKALASLHLTDAVPSNDPDPLSEMVDELLLRIAESVSNRADLFDRTADAVIGRLDRADGAAGIAKRVPAFFNRVRGSGAEVADSLARLINKSVNSAAEGFWRSILSESIMQGVEEEVWKAVSDAVAVDWKNNSTRMDEDDLAAVVSESLASANIGPGASVGRLVQLLLTMNQQRPIESHDVTKILASNFRLIADAVPTELSVGIFEMVLIGKWDDAAWALRRYDQLLAPDVRLICHLELHLAAVARVSSADATRHFLAASDFNLQLHACKAILSRRSGDASGVNPPENVLLRLVRLFSTQSLGHVPVIAQFIEERLQGYGLAPLHSEVSPQDWKNLSLGLGFSEPQQDNRRIRMVAPAGEVATLENPLERQGSLDQVVSALEQIVDSFEGSLEAWDSTDSSLPPNVAPGWDVCLLLLLEIYRTHDLDVRVAVHMSRLLVHFERFKTFYDSLSEKTRRALPKYAEDLLPKLLEPEDFSPLRFSRALESGTISILVGSALQASERRQSSNIAYDMDRCADRIVRGVLQPQAHVETDPPFLGEVLFNGLTNSLSRFSPRAPDESQEPDSRKGRSDLCSRLLTSMQFPTGDRLSDEQEFQAWSHLLIAYMDSTPPSTAKGKARTKQALIRTAVVLDAIDQHVELEGSESSSIEPVLLLRGELQSALQSWLAQGRDVDNRRKLLGRALHVRTDADLPSDGGEQDRYRIDKLLARELSQAGIGVMPAVTGGLQQMWRGSDDDLLAWICGWIRPPTGMPSEPDDAEIAARATISFLDGFATAADIGEGPRRALLVGLTHHFASQASGRVLFDHLPRRLEQELLVKVLRVLLDAGSSSNRIRSQSKEFEAIRSAYEHLRDLSQGDPHKIEEIRKQFDELARSQ